jgi:hypothetical protein
MQIGRNERDFTKYCAHVLVCDRLVTKICRCHQFNTVSEDSGSKHAIRGLNLAGCGGGTSVVDGCEI